MNSQNHKKKGSNSAEDNFNDAARNEITRDQLLKIQNTWDIPKNLKIHNQTCEEKCGLSQGGLADKLNHSLLGKRKQIFQIETVKNEPHVDKSTDSNTEHNE